MSEAFNTAAAGNVVRNDISEWQCLKIYFLLFFDFIFFLEILYGFAPYHSRTIEELHLKVLNDTPIIVNNDNNL